MPTKIKLKVFGARDLPVMNSSQTTDAYVEVKLHNLFTQKTEIAYKTLNPIWDAEFLIEVSHDRDVLKHPLEIKVWDKDNISKDDVIGGVLIDLSNLLLNQYETNDVYGWFPIYDTMRGVRGELKLSISVDFFGKTTGTGVDSTASVLYSHSPCAPPNMVITQIHGFVEELLVNHDPESSWLDPFRSARLSNDTRQYILYKSSSKLRREMGTKVVGLGGNAVIGFVQCIDFENQGNLVIRGYGTAVTLKIQRSPQLQSNILSSTSTMPPPNVTGDDSNSSRNQLNSSAQSKDSTKGDSNSLANLLNSMNASNITNTASSLTAGSNSIPTNENQGEWKSSSNPNSLQSSNPNSNMVSTSNEDEISRILGTNSASGMGTNTATIASSSSTANSSTSNNPNISSNTDTSSKPDEMFSVLKMHAGDIQFLTISSFPPPTVVRLAGIIKAHSIKLISKSNDEKKDKARAVRDRWWGEIRTEMKNHARFLGCSYILGYRETVTCYEDTVLLTATGTAANLKVLASPAKSHLTSSKIHSHLDIAKEQPDSSLSNNNPNTSNNNNILTSTQHNEPQYPLAAPHLESGIESQMSNDPNSLVTIGPNVLTTTIEIPVHSSHHLSSHHHPDHMPSSIHNPLYSSSAHNANTSSLTSSSAASSTTINLSSNPKQQSADNESAHAYLPTTPSSSQSIPHHSNSREMQHHPPTLSPEQRQLQHNACGVCHIPYKVDKAPYKLKLERCRLCGSKPVPEILLANIDPPPGLVIVGHGQLIEAYATRSKKREKEDSTANGLAEAIPFLEYDLYQQILSKMKVLGFNACFKFEMEISVGEHAFIGYVQATAMCLSALPPPDPISSKIPSGASMIFKALHQQLAKTSHDHAKVHSLATAEPYPDVVSPWISRLPWATHPQQQLNHSNMTSSTSVQSHYQQTSIQKVGKESTKLKTNDAGNVNSNEDQPTTTLNAAMTLSSSKETPSNQTTTTAETKDIKKSQKAAALSTSAASNTPTSPLTVNISNELPAMKADKSNPGHSNPLSNSVTAATGSDANDDTSNTQESNPNQFNISEKDDNTMAIVTPNGNPELGTTQEFNVAAAAAVASEVLDDDHQPGEMQTNSTPSYLVEVENDLDEDLMGLIASDPVFHNDFNICNTEILPGSNLSIWSNMQLITIVRVIEMTLPKHPPLAARHQLYSVLHSLYSHLTFRMQLIRPCVIVGTKLKIQMLEDDEIHFFFTGMVLHAPTPWRPSLHSLLKEYEAKHSPTHGGTASPSSPSPVPASISPSNPTTPSKSKANKNLNKKSSNSTMSVDSSSISTTTKDSSTANATTASASNTQSVPYSTEEEKDSIKKKKKPKKGGSSEDLDPKGVISREQQSQQTQGIITSGGSTSATNNFNSSHSSLWNSSQLMDDCLTTEPIFQTDKKKQTSTSTGASSTTSTSPNKQSSTNSTNLSSYAGNSSEDANSGTLNELNAKSYASGSPLTLSSSLPNQQLQQSLFGSSSAGGSMHSIPHIEITPLCYIPGTQLGRFVGTIHLSFIRETFTLKDAGGISVFTQSLIVEAQRIARAHVLALGANVLASYRMNLTQKIRSVKNQAYSIVTITGDAILSLPSQQQGAPGYRRLAKAQTAINSVKFTKS